MRESLFARLGDLESARVLDLFAGSGALGVEALSRGAARVVFVERSARVARCLRENLGALELDDQTELLRDPVARALARLGQQGSRFDLVLADPPYGSAEAADLPEQVARAELLAPRGMLVIETSRRHPPGDAAGLVLLDERTYGDTQVWRFGRAPTGGPAPDAPRGDLDS